MAIKHLSDNEHINQELEKSLRYDCAKLAGIGVLAALPAVGALVFVSQSCNTYSEYKLKKQIRTFLEQLLEGNLTEEDIRKHIEHINKDFTDGVMYAEFLVNMLTTHTNNSQSKFLAKIYKAFVLGKITKDEYVELAEVNSRMFERDYYAIWNKYRDNQNENDFKDMSYRYDRLLALGIVRSRYITIQDKEMVVNQEKYELTEFGKRFAEYVIGNC